MISPHLQEIERDLRTLSLEELEWLLQRITEQVQERKQTSDNLADVQYMNAQLAAMAEDLDIQVELTSINNEFGITEMDGLEKL
ncbi:hypothetical protein BV372_03925 [Nostoc sp. T09]|uniref:hypothetical protein n=1 Tax=Nostoc sp. T09 TaxID=1932621 RepID=UPI000B6E173B|nr:hypothetical protein [Nostoc sp. T09]OUL37151.1 hypothetical protein BV372_03925 [Nostoc sp. T09]